MLQKKNHHIEIDFLPIILILSPVYAFHLTAGRLFPIYLVTFILASIQLLEKVLHRDQLRTVKYLAWISIKWRVFFIITNNLFSVLAIVTVLIDFFQYLARKVFHCVFFIFLYQVIPWREKLLRICKNTIRRYSTAIIWKHEQGKFNDTIDE